MLATNPSSIVFQEWEQIVGEKNLITDSDKLATYCNNVSSLNGEILAVLRPDSTEEVRDIVQVANRHQMPLYPISCGKNWGLGSRLPVRLGATIIDLGRMNRIQRVDTKYHYAVVEPGVTQGQLYHYLLENDLPLTLNVTGSGLGCSLIGNALERGIGYFSSRANSLSGMEIVLGTGEILQTGFRHIENSKTTHIYPHGIGPSLDGLFFQSNFGIVTSAGVDLIPRSESHMGVIASLRDEADLDIFIEVLANLRKNQAFRSIVHIPNRYRTEITLGPLVYETLDNGRTNHSTLRKRTVDLLQAEGFGPWSAVIGISGTQEQVQLAKKQLTKELKTLAKLVFMTEKSFQTAEKITKALDFLPFFHRKNAILNATKPLNGLSRGVPTNATLGSLYWPIGEMPPIKKTVDPDQSPCGMLYCLPMMPLSGTIAVETMKQSDEICRRHGFQLCTTLNIIDSKTLEAVISVTFDQRQLEQRNAAHRCLDELQQYFMDQGYMPYRVGIQSMSTIVNEDDFFWRTARDLKALFDPNHIISPGRYNLV
jgi:4-cresol dehydrogenase (hydroxylating) flavoprotein subunit